MQPDVIVRVTQIPTPITTSWTFTSKDCTYTYKTGSVQFDWPAREKSFFFHLVDKGLI